MPDETLYAFGDFRLDAGRRLLSHRGQRTIPLATRTFDTLLFLVRNPGRIVAKPELMEAVWGDPLVEENNLTHAISTLRLALGEQPDEHRFIVTEPGRGYRFIANVTRSGVSTPDAIDSVAPPAAPPGWHRQVLIALAVVAGLVAVVVTAVLLIR